VDNVGNKEITVGRQAFGAFAVASPFEEVERHEFV